MNRRRSLSEVEGEIKEKAEEKYLEYLKNKAIKEELAEANKEYYRIHSKFAEEKEELKRRVTEAGANYAEKVAVHQQELSEFLKKLEAKYRLCYRHQSYGEFVLAKEGSGVCEACYAEIHKSSDSGEYDL